MIVLGGLGTWLVSPAGVPVVGASGVVFGYATYLLTRGFFNHSLLEILAGVVVGAVFGSALLASLVPARQRVLAGTPVRRDRRRDRRLAAVARPLGGAREPRVSRDARSPIARRPVPR